MILDPTLPFVISTVERFKSCKMPIGRTSLDGIWTLGHVQTTMNQARLNKLIIHPETTLYSRLDTLELMSTPEWSQPESELITLDVHKYAQIYDLSINCEIAIVGGFPSVCLGEEKQFDSSFIDQSNIAALCSMAMLVLNGLADDELTWKESGVIECYKFEPMQLIQLGKDLYKHVSLNKKKYESLKLQVLQCENEGQLNAIVW